MATTDEELMSAIALGSRAALGTLYDRHAPKLLAVGVRVLRDRADAEEVLHDVVLEAWQRAGDYDPSRGSVRTWLSTRMRSRSVDRLKSLSRVRTLAVGHGIDHVADARSGSDSLADAPRLHRALSVLPEEQRRVVELGYFGGLSFSRVARALGVPLGTVKSRMHAAMSKLRAELVEVA